MLSQCACVHSVGCGGGVGGAHGHPGCTRALLNHCCAHCGPPSHAIALLWSCTLSFVVYFLLSSGTLHRRNLAFHGTPHERELLSEGCRRNLTLHGTYLSHTMGPLSHPAWTLSHPLWDALLTLHGTPLSLTPSPSYYTPPRLTHLCTHLCIHHLTHHCAFPPQDPPLLPAHHRVRHLTHHSPNPQPFAPSPTYLTNQRISHLTHHLSKF